MKNYIELHGDEIDERFKDSFMDDDHRPIISELSKIYKFVYIITIFYPNIDDDYKNLLSELDNYSSNTFTLTTGPFTNKLYVYRFENLDVEFETRLKSLILNLKAADYVRYIDGIKNYYFGTN
jgi:hypothetical protein